MGLPPTRVSPFTGSCTMIPVSPRAKSKVPDWPPRKTAEFWANRISPPKEMVCLPRVMDRASLAIQAGASHGWILGSPAPVPNVVLSVQRGSGMIDSALAPQNYFPHRIVRRKRRVDRRLVTQAASSPAGDGRWDRQSPTGFIRGRKPRPRQSRCSAEFRDARCSVRPPHSYVTAFCKRLHGQRFSICQPSLSSKYVLKPQKAWRGQSDRSANETRWRYSDKPRYPLMRQ